MSIVEKAVEKAIRRDREACTAAEWGQKDLVDWEAANGKYDRETAALWWHFSNLMLPPRSNDDPLWDWAEQDRSGWTRTLWHVNWQVMTMASEMICYWHGDPETTAGLRKLLEARDCFVRATRSWGVNYRPPPAAPNGRGRRRRRRAQPPALDAVVAWATRTLEDRGRHLPFQVLIALAAAEGYSRHQLDRARKRLLAAKRIDVTRDKKRAGSPATWHLIAPSSEDVTPQQ